MRVMIINGPNLNLLGVREKSIYGDISFEQYLLTLKQEFPSLELNYFQSNIEGEIIDKLQDSRILYRDCLVRFIQSSRLGGIDHSWAINGFHVRAINDSI